MSPTLATRDTAATGVHIDFDATAPINIMRMCGEMHQELVAQQAWDAACCGTIQRNSCDDTGLPRTCNVTCASMYMVLHEACGTYIAASLPKR